MCRRCGLGLPCLPAFGIDHLQYVKEGLEFVTLHLSVLCPPPPNRAIGEQGGGGGGGGLPI